MEQFIVILMMSKLNQVLNSLEVISSHPHEHVVLESDTSHAVKQDYEVVTCINTSKAFSEL